MFLLPKVEYLGHIIDESGLHPMQDKVKAIQDAPAPKNLAELRSFLGIVNYYSRFLPNLSTRLAPLYALLKKGSRWCWKTTQDEAFQEAKQALQADSLLVHFDSSKQLLLACDASPKGLGAVLSHVMDDGQERPIAYASRTLTPAEQGYSQLEKEGLAIVFGVKKFHNYIYGRQFHIDSDHQPLSYLFNQAKAISPTASARIQRWALTLSAYQYTIRHKAGRHLSNADALSRLPRPVTTSSDCLPGDWVHLLDHLSSTTVNAAHIKQWTDTNPVLSRVHRCILQGWPQATLGDDFKPYIARKNELSVLNGCILWGSRVVVPPQGQAKVLAELHSCHTGACKMKMLARSYFWWPKLDNDIEKIARECPNCQLTGASPPKAPLHPWEWPTQPWGHLHLDFAGPFMGHMYLVIVDAHSKWMNVEVMQQITAEKTIQKLRSVFSTHGVPQKIVTDNGPTFRSEQFQAFTKENGIRHIFSAPYQPSSNGLAERAVQTMKQALRQMQGSGTIFDKLSRFLFMYRITPRTSTGVAPSKLLMGRRLRSRFDLLHPEYTLSKKVDDRQHYQKRAHDNQKPFREFREGDSVYTKDFTSSSQKWMEGIVAKVNGPLSYNIKLKDGNLVRRHVDSIKPRITDASATETLTETSSDDELEGTISESTQEDQDVTSSELVSSAPTSVGLATDGSAKLSLGLRRSTRIRRPPKRYGQEHSSTDDT